LDKEFMQGQASTSAYKVQSEKKSLSLKWRKKLILQKIVDDHGEDK
jgi:hypothetical protein